MTIYPDSVRSYDDLVRYDGPLAFWRLEETAGTVAANDIGTANVGALNGGYTFGEGPLPSSIALALDGSSGYVSISDTTGFPSSGPCTIEAWVNMTTHFTSRAIFSYGAGTTRNLNQIRFAVYSGVPYLEWNWFGDDLSVPITTWSGWHHVMGTYDGSVRRLFIDGVQVGIRTQTGAPNWTLSNIRIGQAATNGEFLGGRISRVSFYTKCLTPEQDALHYLAAKGSLPPTERDVIGSSSRWRFRYWKSDHDLNRIEDASMWIESGNLAMSTDRAVKKTLTVKTHEDVDLNELGDHLLVEAIVTDSEGNEITKQLGLFHTDFPKERHLPSYTQLTFTAYDHLIHLQDQQVTSTLVLDKGNDVVEAILSILTSLGITRVNIPYKSVEMAFAFSWEIGTPYLQIITDLLNLIGYYAPWFDESDTITSRPYDDLNLTAPSGLYRTDGDSIVLPPFEIETNSEGFANQVIIVSTVPDSPVTASATNTDPSSPCSTVSLGYTKTKKVEIIVNGQTEANERAVIELQRAAAVYRRGRLRTGLDPRRSVNELYELDLYRGVGMMYEEYIESRMPSLYWRMGEADGQFIDHSGNGNHGVLTGTVDVIRNIPGAVLESEDDGGIAFTYPGATIECAAVSGLERGYYFHDEVWVWFDRPPQQEMTLLDIGYPGSPQTLYGRKLTMLPSMYPKLYMSNGTTTVNTFPMSVPAVPLGRWVHLVSLRSTQIQVWADGNVVSYFTTPQQITRLMEYDAGLTLGPVSDLNCGLRVDEVAVYNFHNNRAPYSLAAVEEHCRNVARLAARGADKIATGRWWALGWSMPLQPGETMTHEVARVESVG